jgi:hypothetical protein
LFDELPFRREECLGRAARSRDPLALIVPRGQWPSIKQGFLRMVYPFTTSKKHSIIFASGMRAYLQIDCLIAPGLSAAATVANLDPGATIRPARGEWHSRMPVLRVARHQRHVGFGVVHLALSRGLRLYAAFLGFRSACASLRLCSRVSDIAGSSGVTGSGSSVHRRDRVVEPDEPATSFVTAQEQIGLSLSSRPASYENHFPADGRFVSGFRE